MESTPTSIPLGQIRPSPSNPRKKFDDASLAELAESIRGKGLLQPILVRPRGNRPCYELEVAGIVSINQGEVTGTVRKPDQPCYELVAGERRWRAARLADLQSIPAIVRELSDQDVLEIQIIENEQREDVGAIEKADGYALAVEKYGLTPEYLAQKTGKSVSTIRELLKLRLLPEAARAALVAGEITASVAGLIARLPSAGSRQELTDWVLQGHQSWLGNERTSEPHSYRAVKARIQHRFQIELKGAPFDRKALDLVAGATDCHSCPRRMGNLQKAEPGTWEGARADVCTDPPCYQEKVKAFTSRALADAEVRGQKVLGAGELKKVFPWGANHVAYDAAYFDLAEQCSEDRARKKPRSYKQLLEGYVKENQLVLALDSTGAVHRLVPKDLAVPILKEHHGLYKHGSASAPRTSEQEKQDRRKRLEEGRQQRAARSALLAAVADGTAALFARVALPRDLPQVNQVLRVVLGRILRDLWTASREDICARRGLGGKTSQEQLDLLRGFALSADAHQLLGLVVELTAAQVLFGYSSGEQGEQLCTALGIDRAALEKEAKRAAVKPAKPAGKKTPSPAPAGPAKPEPRFNQSVPLSGLCPDCRAAGTQGTPCQACGSIVRGKEYCEAYWARMRQGPRKAKKPARE